MTTSTDEDSDSATGTQQTFFATCARGLGPLLATEVSSSYVGGAIESVANSGVLFHGGWDVGYRACLWLRTAMRVLVLLGELEVDVGEDIYGRVYDMGVNWGELVGRGGTFGVEARFSREAYGDRMGHWIQRRVKDAICDWIKNEGGWRPEKPGTYALADVGFFVTLYEGRLAIYRDMSGFSLHKRGYRGTRKVHRSVLNETVAAGMLLWGGFDPQGRYYGKDGVEKEEVTVVDPMCGSGTILIEAALLRLRVAPGLYRSQWPFERWPDFEPKKWLQAVEDASALQLGDQEAKAVFLGNDWHSGALELSDIAVRSQRLGSIVKLSNIDTGDLRLSSSYAENAVLFSNPPWGERIGDEEESWYCLGQFLRKEMPDRLAFLLSGNKHATRKLRMKMSRRTPVRIGNTDCRFLEYKVLPRKPEDNQVSNSVQVDALNPPMAPMKHPS